MKGLTKAIKRRVFSYSYDIGCNASPRGRSSTSFRNSYCSTQDTSPCHIESRFFEESVRDVSVLLRMISRCSQNRPIPNSTTTTIISPLSSSPQRSCSRTRRLTLSQSSVCSLACSSIINIKPLFQSSVERCKRICKPLQLHLLTVVGGTRPSQQIPRCCRHDRQHSFLCRAFGRTPLCHNARA